MGGVDCKEIAFLRKEKTIINLVKDVIIINIDGAKESTVSKTKICMLVAVLSPSWPKLSSIEDISLGSLSDSEDLITETLVEIYISQGYYVRAISGYEKLSLKYPEKSTYFASRIKEIENLIKNQ